MANEHPFKGQELSKSDNWPVDPPTKADSHQDDELVSLSVARGWLPRAQGKKISLDTLYRWCLKGLKNGVRLEAVKIGSRWFTTRKGKQCCLNHIQVNQNVPATEPTRFFAPSKSRALYPARCGGSKFL